MIEETKILILPYGWVFVGKYENLDDGECILTDASNVRKYYTGGGLGPLAKGGPTTNGCVLDAIGTISFQKSSIIGIIDCDAVAWQ